MRLVTCPRLLWWLIPFALLHSLQIAWAARIDDSVIFDQTEIEALDHLQDFDFKYFRGQSQPCHGVGCDIVFALAYASFGDHEHAVPYLQDLDARGETLGLSDDPEVSEAFGLGGAHLFARKPPPSIPSDDIPTIVPWLGANRGATPQIAVSIQSATFPARLATAQSETVLNAEGLHLAPEVTMASSHLLPHAFFDKLNIGPLSLRSTWVVDRPAPSTLGLDLLNRFSVVTFDRLEGKVGFNIRGAGFHNCIPMRLGIQAGPTLLGPVIDVSLGGQKVRALVDTAWQAPLSTMGKVTVWAVNPALLVDPDEEGETSSIRNDNLHDHREQPQQRISAIELGISSQRFSTFAVIADEQASSRLRRAGIELVLSADAFNGGNFTLDMSRHELCD